MLSYSVSSCFPGSMIDTEYESTTIVPNVGNYLSVDTTHDVTSHTTGLFSSMAGKTLDLSGIATFDAEELLTFRRKIASCDGDSVDIRRGETLKTKVIHLPLLVKAWCSKCSASSALCHHDKVSQSVTLSCDCQALPSGWQQAVLHRLPLDTNSSLLYRLR
jgi:hypothetical protein